MQEKKNDNILSNDQEIDDGNYYQMENFEADTYNY
jgi:hypothetical protein